MVHEKNNKHYLVVGNDQYGNEKLGLLTEEELIKQGVDPSKLEELVFDKKERFDATNKARNAIFGAILLTTSALSGLIGYGIASKKNDKNNYQVPAVELVQRNHSRMPSNLELKLEDLDKDGKSEVYIKHNTQDYLLMLNDNVEPEIVPIKIEYSSNK